MSKSTRRDPRPKRRLKLRWPEALRPRLLPITIFTAVLMLGLRVGDLWHALGGAELSGITEVQAPFAPQPAAGMAAAVAAPAPEPATQQSPTNIRATAGTGDASSATGGSSETFGPLQLELLQRLTERREDLDRRTRELDQREALLAAAEKQIDQKIAELSELRSNIEKLLRQANEKQQAQIDSLVKIYESMKPKDAARIFEELDMPILLDVMERMREAKSAPILAAMDPSKAKEVTASLAERRAIPGQPR